jgi:hypothetical protein
MTEFLRGLIALLTSPVRGRRGRPSGMTAPRRRAFRPALEALEERCNPGVGAAPAPHFLLTLLPSSGWLLSPLPSSGLARSALPASGLLPSALPDASAPSDLTDSGAFSPSPLIPAADVFSPSPLVPASDVFSPSPLLPASSVLLPASSVVLPPSAVFSLSPLVPATDVFSPSPLLPASSVFSASPLVPGPVSQAPAGWQAPRGALTLPIDEVFTTTVIDPTATTSRVVADIDPIRTAAGGLVEQNLLIENVLPGPLLASEDTAFGTDVSLTVLHKLGDANKERNGEGYAQISTASGYTGIQAVLHLPSDPQVAGTSAYMNFYVGLNAGADTLNPTYQIEAGISYSNKTQYAPAHWNVFLHADGAVNEPTQLLTPGEDVLLTLTVAPDGTVTFTVNQAQLDNAGRVVESTLSPIVPPETTPLPYLEGQPLHAKLVAAVDDLARVSYDTAAFLDVSTQKPSTSWRDTSPADFTTYHVEPTVPIPGWAGRMTVELTPWLKTSLARGPASSTGALAAAGDAPAAPDGGGAAGPTPNASPSGPPRLSDAGFAGVRVVAGRTASAGTTAPPVVASAPLPAGALVGAGGVAGVLTPAQAAVSGTATAGLAGELTALLPPTIQAARQPEPAGVGDAATEGPAPDVSPNDATPSAGPETDLVPGDGATAVLPLDPPLSPPAALASSPQGSRVPSADLGGAAEEAGGPDGRLLPAVAAALYLTDFGLVGWLGAGASRRTRLGAVMGTPAYQVGPLSALSGAGRARRRRRAAGGAGGGPAAGRAGGRGRPLLPLADARVAGDQRPGRRRLGQGHRAADAPRSRPARRRLARPARPPPDAQPPDRAGPAARPPGQRYPISAAGAACEVRGREGPPLRLRLDGPGASFAREAPRREEVVAARRLRQGPAAQLVLAADQFLIAPVGRQGGARSVIAGVRPGLLHRGGRARSQSNRRGATGSSLSPRPGGQGEKAIEYSERGAPGRRPQRFSPSHARSLRRGLRDRDHPAQAEAVGDHAEARRPERFAERHLDAAAVGEGVERPAGLRLRRDGEREPDAVELRPVVAAVGRHERHAADAERGVHDLLLEPRLEHPGGRRLRALVEAHHPLDLGAEGLAVELQRLLAAAGEVQVRGDGRARHDFSSPSGPVCPGHAVANGRRRHVRRVVERGRRGSTGPPLFFRALFAARTGRTAGAPRRRRASRPGARRRSSGPRRGPRPG